MNFMMQPDSNPEALTHDTGEDTNAAHRVPAYANVYIAQVEPRVIVLR